MSVQKEEYVIHGCKFGKEFTYEFWKKDFRDQEEWSENKEYAPYFLTDGMNGDYTFFGFILQLADGFDFENTEIIEFSEIEDEDRAILIEKFQKLYPNEQMPEIKMYYVPHYC